MTSGHDPAQLRLLASHLAARAVDVAEALPGRLPHTDGRVVFVSSGGSMEQHRREVLVQAGLLGAGSLDPALVRGLRARSRWRAAIWLSRVTGCLPIWPGGFLLPPGSPSAAR